jgi:hypothetical protein
MNRWMWLGVFLVSCGGGTAPEEAVDTCGLAVDDLGGKSFLMYEAMPDKTYQNNPMARVKFSKDGDGYTAKYTVKHPFRVWDYNCTMTEVKEGEEGAAKDAELRCFEEERPKDWCMALQAHEWGSCTSKKLKKLGSEKTEEELKTLVREAKKEARAVKAEGEDAFNRWKLMNNNLGNRLQQRLYVKRDKLNECGLSMTDMYFTIFNGRGKEDTNPVGINPFVETDVDYGFEHCDGVPNLAPYHSAEPPKKKDEFGNQRTPQMADTDIFYHYVLKDDTLKAAKECAYSYDSYSQYLPSDRSVEVAKDAKGQLKWIGKTVYPSDNLLRQDALQIGVYHMVRYKQCEGGEREKIDVLCAANLVQTPRPAEAAPAEAAPAEDAPE